MRLVERRIGFLFALFLALLVLAAARAAWLGTVESRDLGARALGQQVDEITVYARRGTITDRNGVELAVSEDATTVFANPMQIHDPAGVAHQLAPLLGMPEDEVMEKLSEPDTGFVYLRRKLDPTRGAKIEKLGIEGIGTVVEPRRTYPQGSLAAQVLGSVGTDNYGLTGPRAVARGRAPRHRRHAQDREGRHRQAGQHRRRRARGGGRRRAPHDRRRHPGAHRGGPVRGRASSTSRAARPRS